MKAVKKIVQLYLLFFFVYSIMSSCGPVGTGKANEESNKAGMPDKTRSADSLRRDSENNLLKDTALKKTKP